jgi:hypothetical protein
MLNNVESWIAQPFNANMSLWSWALFILALMCIVYLWNDVLSIIVEGGKEL